MEETQEFEANVRAITNAARGQNRKVGYYKKHFLSTERNATFIVELTNGRIEIAREFARDSLDSLSKDEIEAISKTFIAKEK